MGVMELRVKDDAFLNYHVATFHAHIILSPWS